MKSYFDLFLSEKEYASEKYYIIQHKMKQIHADWIRASQKTIDHCDSEV